MRKHLQPKELYVRKVGDRAVYSHVVMTDGTRILTIPCCDPILATTMDGIVRDAGLSPGRFRQLV